MSDCLFRRICRIYSLKKCRICRIFFFKAEDLKKNPTLSDKNPSFGSAASLLMMIIKIACQIK